MRYAQLLIDGEWRKRSIDDTDEAKLKDIATGKRITIAKSGQLVFSGDMRLNSGLANELSNTLIPIGKENDELPIDCIARAK